MTMRICCTSVIDVVGWHEAEIGFVGQGLRGHGGSPSGGRRPAGNMYPGGLRREHVVAWCLWRPTYPARDGAADCGGQGGGAGGWRAGHTYHVRGWLRRRAASAPGPAFHRHRHWARTSRVRHETIST